MARPRRSGVHAASTVRLRPADPFDLIRWLARSQSDPRKAVAELVQNSLDAGARAVRIERRRHRGDAALVVRDDGEGVIPDLTREEALRYLATHIGHSRKLGLTPTERRERIVAGQYGVGLLGFWAIGRRLELRTRVAGSDLWALRLEEDSATAEVAPLPVPLDAPATFTEIVVAELHAPSQRALAGRRLADFLAAELRGQLLARDVELTIHDGLARGLAQKRFRVTPPRFVGERLSLPETVDVPGHGPLRVELYLARGAERPAIQVACAGTLVAEDIAELEALGLREAPWVGRALTGLLDFPGFTVPPGTRRGVLPDRAAAAFVDALARLESAVLAELSRFDRERSVAAGREVLRDLRKALRGLASRLPQYDMPAVTVPEHAGMPRAASTDPADALPGLGGSGAVAAPGLEVLDDGVPGATLELLSPGPLASVDIRPSRIPVRPGGEHRARAVARDSARRPIRDGVTFRWTLAGAGLSLQGDGAQPAVQADPSARPGDAGTLRVEAVALEGVRAAYAEVAVLVVEPADAAGRAAGGIPEPELVADPAGSWRSRLAGDLWQINESHEDYVALRADPRARLRYLLHLFAKELVFRFDPRPGHDVLLERMVDILAHAERNLRGA